MSSEDALVELRSKLNELVDNNKNQITSLTLLADDYSEYAEQLTDAICKHIYELPPERKLLGIYVMDSILKFADKKENYRRLFGRQVVDVFVDTFQKVPITKRQNLYKVRATWQQQVFPKSKLFDLDVRTKQHDPSWPIWAEKKSSSSTTSSSTAAATTVTNSNDEKSINSNSGDHHGSEKNVQLEKRAPVACVLKVDGKTDVEKEKNEKQNENVKKIESKEKVTIPITKSNDEPKPSITVIGSNPLRDPRKRAQNSLSQSPKKEQVPPTRVLEKMIPPKNQNVPPTQKPSPPTNFSKPKSTTGPMIVVPPPQFLPNIPRPSTKLSQTNGPSNIHPTTTKPSETSTFNAVVGVNQLSKKLEALAPKKKDETTNSNETFKLKEVKQEPMEIDKNLQQKNDYDKDKKKKNKKRSKHEDGNRRHRSPERMGEKKRRIETENHIKPTIAPGSHAFLPNTNLNINTNIISMIPTTISGISPHNSGIKMEIDDSWRKPISTIITNETPKIGLNANNRIFVDGRAYEVHYINDVAIIEQNGLPHRIYFQGPPRRIQVDDKTYELGFEKTLTISIDGDMHDIRFGAPSRELYVGNYPFRGAFGGPPMIANINGKRHEFRLLGAPPEVRIDKDPCYELSRHMPTIRQPQSSIEGMNKDDLSSFLKSLKSKGILASMKPTETVSEKPKQQHIMKGSDKPVVGAATGSVRMDYAPQALKDFAMSALIVRYTDLVDMLHRDRVACTHCGISFPDTKSEAYLQHIDNHVQDLLRSKDTKAAKYQTLYMNYDEWVEYDELADVLKISTQESTKSHPFNEEESIQTTNVIGSPSDPLSTNLNKFCSVCHEKFNEYYDNEEDEWRFQDCVIKNHQAIHRDCLEQLGDVEMENETAKSNNDFDSIKKEQTV